MCGKLSFNYSNLLELGFCLEEGHFAHNTHTDGVLLDQPLLTSKECLSVISVTNLLAASWCRRMQLALLSDKGPSGFLQVIGEDAH